MYIPAEVSSSRTPNRGLVSVNLSRSTRFSRVASDRECITRTGVFCWMVSGAALETCA